MLFIGTIVIHDLAHGCVKLENLNDHFQSVHLGLVWIRGVDDLAGIIAAGYWVAFSRESSERLPSTSDCLTTEQKNER